MLRVLKRFGLKSLFLPILLLGLSHSSFATTVVVPTDDEMIIRARAILRGKIVEIESSFDENHSRIYTYITVKVQEVIKGAITDRFIVIKELGGQVGEHGFRVFGNPVFARGEKVLLYLDTWKDGSLRTHQMFLGKFAISEDKTTGEQIVIRGSSDENVSVRPNDLDPSGPTTDRMELSAYLEMVRGRLSANWERSQNFEETYYHGVPLLAEPGEYKRLRSGGGIEPQWVYISGQHPRWFEPDTGQPVTFVVNTNGAPQSNIMNDINAAMNAWSTVPSCALRIANGGSTTACNEGVGLNLIQFSGCDGRWSPGGCSGVLALGGLSWFGGNTKVINGVTFAQGTAGFVSMNPNAACYFTDHCRVQEVLTHELGHAMGLGHSTDNSATMYAIAHFDGRCATVMTDDMAGVQFIYPGGSGGPGPLTVTTSSLANGITQSSYSQTLLCSGGTPSYSWSIVSGLGNLPAGLSLNSSNGVISGTPTTVGTSNFTVRVTDGASATADKALSIVVSSSGTLPYNSQFVSQNTPTSVNPGQSFNVNMKWLNTGSQTWSAPVFYMVSQNPAYNYTWLGQYNAVDLGQFTVPPGQQIDFTFTVVAPTVAGTYNFQWQLYKDNGTTFFGQPSTNVVVNVGIGQATNYQGYHDGAGCNTIQGWAWDANNPSGTVSVDVYDGNTLIGTVPANMHREDLLNSLGSPNHGFSLNTPASLKNGAPHVIIVKFAGTNTLLSNTGRTIQCSQAPIYYGRHDGQGCNAIEGWAWDATDPNGTVNVDIYEGSTLIATVAATLYRQDLASLGNPYHGWIFHTPPSLRDGQPHTITVKFGGTNTNLPLDTPRTTSCASGTPNLQGNLDSADCNFISGYAWDANDDQGTVVVAIYVDGGVFVVVAAQDAYPGVGTGYHGFKFAVPASLKNGQPHSIQVKFSGTTTGLLNSPNTINCSP